MTHPRYPASTADAMGESEWWWHHQGWVAAPVLEAWKAHGAVTWMIEKGKVVTDGRL